MKNAIFLRTKSRFERYNGRARHGPTVKLGLDVMKTIRRASSVASIRGTRVHEPLRRVAHESYQRYVDTAPNPICPCPLE